MVMIFISCCTKQHNDVTQTAHVNNENLVEQDITKPLIIGGKQYRTRDSLEPSAVCGQRHGKWPPFRIMRFFLFVSVRINIRELNQLHYPSTKYAVQFLLH